MGAVPCLTMNLGSETPSLRLNHGSAPQLWLGFSTHASCDLTLAHSVNLALSLLCSLGFCLWNPPPTWLLWLGPTWLPYVFLRLRAIILVLRAQVSLLWCPSQGLGCPHVS